MLDKIIYVIIITLVTYVLKQLISETPNFVKFKSKFLIFYIWTSLTSVILLPFFVFNPKNVKNALVATQIVKHVTRVIEVKWHLINGRVLAEDRGAVVVSNHQSSIDILGMFNIWHIADKIAAIARKEIFYVWPFGLAAYLAGVVDTEQRFYPTAAVQERSFQYRCGRSSHVVIQCLEPVPTLGLTMEDVPELIVKIRNIMETAYKELSKEVLSSLPADYPLATVD
ncbi:Acyltransferase AGPAT3 [Operophtera brumata]|uniref:1-acylglycerol-3-phosphate O-acyltransferase n=1 Tax=Operophtera brumata TaxID=104452 RepID=A0A0L7LN34_OPEBR|nr:Acyltransferase AGPAT3 [Operophtera brumata]